ncbi:adhesion G-protein coupled receptor D1 [Hemitrygon akajei]|uniref:adhesion G-protein coupled receptor D1 n=1 Tax=Hemitrygon akajei TaxID=2704970 RepID=UPI003BF984C8
MSGPRAVQLPLLLLSLLRGTWSGRGTGGGDGPRNCSAESCVSSPQVGGQEPGLAGIQVLKSASHYWPLGHVEGLNELCDVNGSQTVLRSHRFTVLPSYNSSFLYTIDSAFSNLSPVVDVVEGVVNKGIYLNGNAGATLLHFGSSKNSCISDLEQCGEAGVSFSFFWKNLDKQSGASMPSGGKLMSNRFSVYASVNNGFIEFYTRKTSRSWKASISPPGTEWTHILFTWSPVGGLKVYVNGTFSTNDTYGKESADSGNQHANLVTSTQKVHSYGHYVTGSFDEFVIWERALSPLEIQLYFNATIGLPVCNPGNGPSMSLGDLGAGNSTMENPTTSSTNYPGTAQPREEDKRFTGGGVLSPPFAFPNKTLQHQTASNLTEQYLQTVGEFLDMLSLTESVEAAAEVSVLIETVDNVLDHVVTSLEGDPDLPVSIKGTSLVADYLLVKVADGSSLSSYRFPSQGLSYIFIPGEAFHSKKQVLMVGMFYHSMHQFYRQINPLKTKISEAAVHKDHPIAVTSHIISLKIDPPPSLSHNLSGSPLTTISLTHILNPAQHSGVQNESSLIYFWCAFLDFSSGTGVWSNEGCIRIGGNASHSVCFCNHLTNFAILMQVVPLEPYDCSHREV